jgi:hypothetical protein
MIAKYTWGLFGRGRSSVRRAAVGLAVAPLVAVVVLPVPLLASFYVNGTTLRPFTDSDFSIVIAVLGAAFAAAVVVTIAIALPTWLILRWLRRESGKAYASAGAIVGLIPPYLLLRDASVGPFALPAQWELYGLCEGCGLITALSFWGIAKER